MVNLPGHSAWLWIAPGLVAFAVSVAATPLAIRLARTLGVIDHPVGAKIHLLPTPLLGGLAIFAAFLLGCAVFLPVAGPVRGIILGGAIAIGVGVLDDKLNLPPLLHLGGQALAAVVTVTTGVGIVKTISNPFASSALIAHGEGNYVIPAVLGLGFTLFWIVGMMNTVNFLDGLDGLSTGVGAITAILLALWAANHHADLALPAVLAGALLGFLPFNWNPAKIFIGDSGAMFLGLALASISITAPAKIGTALLILVIPVLDVAWAIVRRYLKGKSFLSGDKQHVYHRMIEVGMSPRVTVLSLYALCIALALPDLLLPRLVKLAAFVLVGLATAGAFIWLEIAGNSREVELSQTSKITETG